MRNGIRYLIMDVDGTLTDGKIYIGNSGEVFKAFNIKDGYGIKNILPRYEINPIILTGRESEIVKKRAIELNIGLVFQGIQNKENFLLHDILKNINDFRIREVAFIGDDLNDMAAIDLVKENKGIIGCPKNAVDEILRKADFVSKHNGGDGAVRDFIEWIIK